MSFLLTSPITSIIAVLTAGLFFSSIFVYSKMQVIRQFTLSVSLAALFIGLLSCLSFDKSNLGFQFFTNANFVYEYNLALTLGMDGLSTVFLLLTLFIFPVLFLAAWSVTRQPKHFINYLLAMELLLVLTFTTTDLLYFFIFFESLLIPMFLLIGIWGARARKIKAGYYFFLYTLFGSLFMLFGVLYLYMILGSTNYSVLAVSSLDSETQCIIWLCFFLAFAVKMPLFPLHIWLPEAHVEAPTVGSMLLASLLLKLGGYGFLRFSLTLLAEGTSVFMPIVAACALLGVIYGSLSTLRQIDFKRVIAYSSVAHMNLVMLGIFSLNHQGLDGAIYLMLGHGIVSTALFFTVGVLYDRYHSRILLYYGGLVTVMPLFATFFFFFTLANMSFPATSNFLGELLIFLGIFAQNTNVLLFSTAGIVLAAAYSVWLYNRIAFGALKIDYIKEFTDLNARETLLFVVLLIPMFVLGVTANFILDFTYLPVKAILHLSMQSMEIDNETSISLAYAYIKFKYKEKKKEHPFKAMSFKNKVVTIWRNWNWRRDLGALVIALGIGVIGIIAISHTLQVAFYFGLPLFATLLLPLIACIAAISVIVQKNAINSLLSLMCVFLTSALIYLFFGAGYFALVFLLIGQGAVAILFLYAVILLPLRAVQKDNSPSLQNKQVFAISVGITGFIAITRILNESFTNFFSNNITALRASEGTSGAAIRRFVNEEALDVLSFASLYSHKGFLFFLITIILLSSMLGAIILATLTNAQPGLQQTPVRKSKKPKCRKSR